MIKIILGNIGCIVGDTEIRLNRNKKGFKQSIKSIYNQWNKIPMKSVQQWDLKKATYVRSFKGEKISLHKIKNVTYSGIKEVFCMTLNNNNKLKCTLDHKIQTRKGMIQLQNLKIGSNVMCDTLKPIHAEKNTKNFNQGIPIFSKIKSIEKIGLKPTYDIECENPFHNFVANNIVIHNSGKTATAVRYMKANPHKMFITNIDTKGKDFKHVLKLKSHMIITKEVISVKKNGEENTKLSLNITFWQELIKKYGAINVIIDEAHIFFNPRRSMSKLNILMTDFLALLRRVLGSTEGTGELILITQISRRLDIIAKEMATDVTYCIHHYKMRCSKCSCEWQETNEQPDRLFLCPKCNDYNLKRTKSMIEMFNFQNIDIFDAWKNSGYKGYYKHYMINDIHKIFGNYETLQFNDLFSEF